MDDAFFMGGCKTLGDLNADVESLANICFATWVFSITCTKATAIRIARNSRNNHSQVRGSSGRPATAMKSRQNSITPALDAPADRPVPLSGIMMLSAAYSMAMPATVTTTEAYATGKLPKTNFRKPGK